jgi:hypothetical protein
MVSIEEIVEAARNLPEKAFEEMADRIVESRYGKIDPKIAKAWDVEIKRRLDEIDSGAAVGIPADQVFAKAQALLRK